MEHTGMAVSQQTGIADAIKAAETQEQLAATLGVSQQAVSAWLTQGFVPKDRAREIEMQYGIPRARLLDPKLLDAVSSETAL